MRPPRRGMIPSMALPFRWKPKSKRLRRGFRHSYISETGIVAGGIVRVLNEAQRDLLMQAIVMPVNKTAEGTLVDAFALPWLEIAKMFKADATFMYKLDWRKFEEFIAGAYKKAGFDEVTLTPRSGDQGRDVIAVKKGLGALRIVEQVKKYSPQNLVTADDVRALYGVLSLDPNATKGVVTTTSRFAPGIESDPLLAKAIPYRLELRDGAALTKWIDELMARG